MKKMTNNFAPLAIGFGARGMLKQAGIIKPKNPLLKKKKQFPVVQNIYINPLTGEVIKREPK